MTRWKQPEHQAVEKDAITTEDHVTLAYQTIHGKLHYCVFYPPTKLKVLESAYSIVYKKPYYLKQEDLCEE